LRKYGEYAKRVREIREGGGNAGMLTRREWYEINKNNLRDAWKDAHGRSAPLDFEPPAPRNRRPQNNRRRRRQATAQGAGRSATRKPTSDDVPESATKKPIRPAARRVWADRTEVKASREAVANAVKEIKRDPNHVWSETFDKQVEAILREPKAVSEPELRELIDLVEGIEDDKRGQIRLIEQMGQRADVGVMGDLLKISEQNGKLRQALNANGARRTPAKPNAVDKPQIELSSKWKKNTDGTWERNGYKLTATFNADGKLEKFVLQEPYGNSFEMGYGGPNTKRDINNFAEYIYGIAGGSGAEPDFASESGENVVSPPRAPARRRGGNAQQLKMNNLVDNHYTELPKLQPDDGKFVAVRVGNKGINTLADARRYRGSLADIPDEFLLDVIQKRTHKDRGAMSPNVVDAVRSVFPSADDAEVVQIMKRLSANFRRSLNEAPPAIDEDTKKLIKALKDKNIEFIEVPASSGITSPLYYFHLSDDPAKWGRGYFLKKPDRGWESNQGNGKKISQHAELIGNILAKQIGFANGAPRLVKGSNNNPFLLMDIFVNNAEGKVAGRYSPGGVTDAKSRFFNGALNAIMNVADRHNGNGDQIKGNGAIPLDFGRALFGRKSASGQMQYLSRLMMDQASWGGYSKRLNGKVGAAKTREVNAIRAELQADIALAAENMRVGLRRVNEMNQAFDALDIDAKDDRMADLVYNIDQFASPEYLDLLMQKINP
jgi:hypothetical protein